VWYTNKLNGQPQRKLDVSRVEERFGFVSATLFENRLQSTIVWYRTEEIYIIFALIVRSA